MPYIARSVPQALDLLDPGVQDIYSSPSVYVNNVPVALYQAPVIGNSVLSQMAIPPDPPVEDYAPNPEQKTAYSARVAYATANPVPSVDLQTGQTVNVVSPNPIATGTDDPNDQVGNPPTVDSPVAPGAGGIWATLENILNSCLTQAQGGGWDRKTGLNAIAPNYQFNPNIMECFNQMGFPKDKLDKAYPGPDPGKKGSGPGDQVAWCAAFAGYVLKGAGSPYLKGNLSAPAFSQRWQAQKIATTDPTQWRRNDLVFFSFSHVSFLRGVDPQNGIVACLGGNQGDRVRLSTFPITQVAYVGRAWTVDPAYDKPIIGPITPGGGGGTR